MEKIDTLYFNALKDIMTTGQEIKPRNMLIKEKVCYLIKSNPLDNIITIPKLETNLKYAKIELDWYLSGSNKIKFHPLIKKIWEKYSDNGYTVNSAYGHRIFGYHINFIDQWEWVKDLLKKDKDTRRAIININYPGDKIKETKDFPCTVYCQVLIRENKLNWVTNMRSNDLFFGYRNDMYCFTELQKLLAKQLKLKVGDYFHFASSMHIYENQFNKINNVINK